MKRNTDLNKIVNHFAYGLQIVILGNDFADPDLTVNHCRTVDFALNWYRSVDANHYSPLYINIALLRRVRQWLGMITMYI